MRRLTLLMLLVLVAACSTTEPERIDQTNIDPEVWFDGDFDGTGLVLERTEVFGPGGILVPVDLVATRLEFDPRTNQLSAEVHITNRSRTDLYGPATVGLSNFTPDSVKPLNASNTTTDPERWWYDYSRTLGDDGILSAGESSAPVTWLVQLPGPGSFSFVAVARFAGEPGRAVLGGRVFADLDRNGRPDPAEPGGSGEVLITAPGERKIQARPDDFGWWQIPATEPGLYTVQWIAPPTAGILPVCLTTPSPLQVLMTPGPDGLPRSFREAHFGVDPEPCRPGAMPILISQVDIDSLHSDYWSLIDLQVRGPSGGLGERLELSIGFPGCGPDHPMVFAVQLPDADRPSVLVATVLHDGLGELCEAWWNEERTVDLGHLRAIWADLTGLDGPLFLELHTPQGTRELPLD